MTSRGMVTSLYNNDCAAGAVGEVCDAWQMPICGTSPRPSPPPALPDHPLPIIITQPEEEEEEEEEGEEKSRAPLHVRPRRPCKLYSYSVNRDFI